MKKYSPSSGFEQKVMLLTWAWLVRVGVFRSSQSASDSPSVNMEDTRVQRKEAEKRWGGERIEAEKRCGVGVDRGKKPDFID